MNPGSHIVWFRKTARRGFAVLALLALALVLARPICDAYEVGAGSPGVGQLAGGEQSNHNDLDPCCASIDDGTPLASVNAASPAKAPIAVLVLAFHEGTWSSATQVPVAAIPPDCPPLLRPYHARTARILV